jgi:hypothetical protein
MGPVIEKCEELLTRFGEKRTGDCGNGRIGLRWHTPDRQDFVDLIHAVKRLAETIDRDQTEID